VRTRSGCPASSVAMGTHIRSPAKTRIELEHLRQRDAVDVPEEHERTSSVSLAALASESSAPCRAEALESLSHLAHALEAGSLSWCAARELETLVGSKSSGDPPDAPTPELPRPRALRFEVAPDTFATFREAMQRLQRSAGGGLDDDALLLAMARHVLGGPNDEGRSSYQISLSVCGTCGGGAQFAGSQLVPVDAAVVDMAACDALHLGESLPLEGSEPTVPAVLRQAVLQAANENASLGADLTAGDGPEGPSHHCAAEPSCDESRASSTHAHVGPTTMSRH
jgi:hypothetical protein